MSVEDWLGEQRQAAEEEASDERLSHEAQRSLRDLAERDRRQAAHERPPKGVTREEWLDTFPTIESYDEADVRIWGPKP